MRRKYIDLGTKSVVLGKVMLPIGFDGMVTASRVVAILDPDTSPAKTLREKATNENRLIDNKRGRPCRSIIVTDSNHVILSAVRCETLTFRMENLNA